MFVFLGLNVVFAQYLDTYHRDLFVIFVCFVFCVVWLVQSLDLAVAKDPHLALAYFQRGCVALQQKRCEHLQHAMFISVMVSQGKEVEDEEKGRREGSLCNFHGVVVHLTAESSVYIYTYTA